MSNIGIRMVEFGSRLGTGCAYVATQAEADAITASSLEDIATVRGVAAQDLIDKHGDAKAALRAEWSAYYAERQVEVGTPDGVVRAHTETEQEAVALLDASLDTVCQLARIDKSETLAKYGGASRADLQAAVKAEWALYAAQAEAAEAVEVEGVRET